MARAAVKYYKADRAGRAALRAGRGLAAHPARGQRGAGRLHARAAAQARHRDPPVDVPEQLRRRPRRAVEQDRSSTPRRSCGPPASRPTRCCRTRTCRWTRWAASRATRSCRWSTPTAPSVPDAYAAGDCAAVPDLYNPGKFCPPNAQHALREGNHLGDNLSRVLRSAELTEYKHKNIGAVASLGMYKGVAQMFGRIKVRGFLAWVLHRTYHVAAMPTVEPQDPDRGRLDRLAAAASRGRRARQPARPARGVPRRVGAAPSRARSSRARRTRRCPPSRPRRARRPRRPRQGSQERLSTPDDEPPVPRGPGARSCPGRMWPGPRSPTGRGSRLKPGTVRVRTPAGAPDGLRSAVMGPWNASRFDDESRASPSRTALVGSRTSSRPRSRSRSASAAARWPSPCARPGHDVDLAAGFLVSEGVVDGRRRLRRRALLRRAPPPTASTPTTCST